jgi:hypothetical protein
MDKRQLRYLAHQVKMKRVEEFLSLALTDTHSVKSSVQRPSCQAGRYEVQDEIDHQQWG